MYQGRKKHADVIIGEISSEIICHTCNVSTWKSTRLTSSDFLLVYQ